MTIQTLRAKRDAYIESGNLAMERLCTMAIWRKLHGIDMAAKVGAKL